MSEKDYETWALSNLGWKRRVVQWLVSRCRLRDCVPRETLHALSDTVSHRPWHIIVTLCSSHQWESKSGWYWALHISYGGSGLAGSQAHSRQTADIWLRICPWDTVFILFATPFCWIEVSGCHWDEGRYFPQKYPVWMWKSHLGT